MSYSLPSEVLIEKLVKNSHNTLSSLRSEFTYDKRITSIPNAVLKEAVHDEFIPEIQQFDDQSPFKLKECKLLIITVDLSLKHMNVFDECIFNASSVYTKVYSLTNV